MTDDTTLDRRRFVQATTAAGATLLLAGCSGGGGGGSGGSGDGGSGGGDGGSGGGSGGDTQYLSEEPDYGGWFDDANNYEQTVDATGRDEVTVRVGAGDGLSFGPAAVAVSTGTTVVWEWTGQGGGHNVSAESGDFESETSQEQGHTFEYTFEETGIQKYVCTPHEAVGMKGAVVVR
ncbi:MULTISPECIES: halocyanin domain-containing protein [Halorubrum]|uniref:Halocyanin domain-containing protein n=1 Tax=Halorubrum sodomense TaxID=35743 RepID=A0A1I6H0S1_HALSD|nr:MULTISPECIES: halocyanin domain-containing protein [Halorubrum]TKX55086.1 halocyanin domain-containing protein [Halorubrum sp. SP3]TKX66577.1 halocyanin domain-containing protein [Halorubrum sp. SP9]SFR48066.1 halocyanin domain-containing protein [Halorubrum sodomense]